ncbi:hypothetical protein BJ546DRAFT_638659 [Cryomyces antarcticus]
MELPLLSFRLHDGLRTPFRCDMHCCGVRQSLAHRCSTRLSTTLAARMVHLRSFAAPGLPRCKSPRSSRSKDVKRLLAGQAFSCPFTWVNCQANHRRLAICFQVAYRPPRLRFTTPNAQPQLRERQEPRRSSTNLGVAEVMAVCPSRAARPAVEVDRRQALEPSNSDGATAARRARLPLACLEQVFTHFVFSCSGESGSTLLVTCSRICCHSVSHLLFGVIAFVSSELIKQTLGHEQADKLTPHRVLT